MLGPDIAPKIIVTSFQVPAQIAQSAPKWETRQNGPLVVITIKSFEDTDIASLNRQVTTPTTLSLRVPVSENAIRVLSANPNVKAVEFWNLRAPDAGNAMVATLVSGISTESQLTQVGINMSDVTDAGILPLIAALEEGLPLSVTTIALRQNLLTSEAALPLARHCHERGISLDISNNRIDPEGANALKRYGVAIIPWSDGRCD